MDVNFEVSSCSKGNGFTIELGFFDTVLEIKEKIQKYQGIPISRQTLIFNGQIMIDERDTEFYEVLDCSHIQLQIEPPSTPTPTPTPAEEQQQQQQQPSGGGGVKINDQETSSSSSTCSKTKIQLLIKIPATKRQFPLGGIDLNDTVLRLKEKIHEGEGMPINRFVLFFSGNELMEINRTLLDYGIADLSEINVVIKTFPSSTTTSSGGGGSMTQPSGGGGGGGLNKRLKLMVLPAKSGAQKIQVEMNSTDNVGELRKELQRLQQQQQQPALAVHLPAEGYFFIYRQTVMEEDRSFRWHDIRQGDTIEIFNGSVTGGS